MHIDPKFGKQPDFIVRQADPFNGGAPVERLVAQPVTPVDLFFVRSHGDVPAVSAGEHRLTVAGLGVRPTTLSLTEVRARFPRVDAPATLQCAGNRRQELAAVRPIPGELPWDAEAISHARWAGVRLRDVLSFAGLDPAAAGPWHVEFTGLDQTERLGQRFCFGGSIPLEKALAAEVLLADEMNGQPLTPAHGFPLRVVVPGYIGARSVKWVTAVTVRAEPSDNYFQRHAYRLFPPQVQPPEVDWDSGLMLGEGSLTSVIGWPSAGQQLAAGPAEVRGYALAGGSRQIARVDLSLDGGQTWRPAVLDGPPEPWSWRLWHAEVSLPAGRHTLVVRAVDTAGNSQPPDPAQVWNFKGYLNNAWHRVTVEVDA